MVRDWFSSFIKSMFMRYICYNIKKVPSCVGISIIKFKSIMKPSYLYDGNSYTFKITSLHWPHDITYPQYNSNNRILLSVRRQRISKTDIKTLAYDHSTKFELHMEECRTNLNLYAPGYDVEPWNRKAHVSKLYWKIHYRDLEKSAPHIYWE